jgi:hypothetical protein
MVVGGKEGEEGKKNGFQMGATGRGRARRREEEWEREKVQVGWMMGGWFLFMRSVRRVLGWYLILWYGANRK